MPVGVFSMPDSEIRAGLLFQGDYQYVVKSAAGAVTESGDGDPTYSHGAELYSLFAPNAVDLFLGAYLTTSSSFDGTNGAWSALYDGPCAPFGGLIDGGAVYKSTVEASATFKNLRVYAMEYGLLRVYFDGVDVDLGNGIVSLGPPVGAESAGIGPNYIPIFGIPPTVSGFCSAGRTNLTPWSYNPCDPDNADGRDWSTEITSSVSGGWRYNEGAGWVDLPVSPYPGTLSAERTYGDLIQCSAKSAYEFGYEGRSTGLTQHYIFTCSSIEDGVVVIGEGDAPAFGIDPCVGGVAPAYGDVYRTHSEYESKTGQITLTPDLGPELKRFAPGFAKLLRRLWFPETRATVSESETIDGVKSSTVTTTTVHPDLGDDFLGLVRDVDVPVLDAFDTTPYAPSSKSEGASSSTTYTAYGTNAFLCPPLGVSEPSGCVGVIGVSCSLNPYGPSGESASSSNSTVFPTYVGASGDYQGHAEPLARYTGTWVNPWWHYFSHRQDWYLQGSNAPWAPVDDEEGYWGPIRTQWLQNGALDDAPLTRSDMIGDPYYDWAYTPIFDEFTGGLPWEGISRWKVREVEFPGTIALTSDSEPMFSSPDDSCDVAVSGGNLVLTPSGSGTITLDVDLIRADCFPYYALLLAKNVKMASYSNVAHLMGSLRSSFGGSVALNSGSDLAAATAYPFVRGVDSGYAGTWGSDSGAGYIVDEGTDIPSGGDSAGHMGNPETLAGFQGLRGLQASVLRLTIEPTSAGDVTLSLPVFGRVQDHPEVRWLDGNKAVMMWPDGPAVLWGAHLTYVPDEGLHWPWLPKGLGTPNTIADALQFVYAVFEATDPGDVAAFNAEVVGLYNSFEVSLENIGSADKHSFALLLPKGPDEKIRFALVQTVSEVPPLACFPTLKRDAYHEATGDPGMERWDQSQEIKYIVSPVDPLILKKPGGTTVSAASSAPSGWSIQEYTQALTGDESDDWKLFAGQNIASVYPWHGWEWVGKPAEAGRILAFLSRGDGRLFRVTEQDGTINLGVSDVPTRATWDDHDLSTTATDASLTRGRGERVINALVTDGSLELRIEASEGRTAPVLTMTDGSATSADVAAFGDGAFAVVKIDGGAVKITLRNARDLSVIKAAVTTNVTGLGDEATVRVDDVRLPGNKPALAILIVDGGTVTTYLTTDLATLTP